METGERERDGGSTSRAECGRAWIDEKGGIGGGPTALVAVERTNFVLIEKSPAPNPIYKPANMAGVGRSLASPRLAPSYRAFRESRYTQRRPGFRVSHAPRIWDKGSQGGSPRRRRGRERKTKSPNEMLGPTTTMMRDIKFSRLIETRGGEHSSFKEDENEEEETGWSYRV